MSALLERSGLIRVRHWAEEAGGHLLRLAQDQARFEAYRLVLSLLSRLALIGVFIAARGLSGSTGLALAVSLATLGITEVTTRILVASSAEQSLSRLTAAYRVASVLLIPLLPLLKLVFPLHIMRRREEGLEVDEASEGEIEAFISVGQREGILDPGEEELVKGVVEFGDTLVKSVMTPRTEVVAAPVDSSAEDLLSLFLDSGHSRLPLYGDSPDTIVGVLHLRDLVAAQRPDQPVDVAAISRSVFVVPETKPIAPLLREFQARHQQLAVVVDEFGGTAGLVTVEDLLEEIVGEIVDEHEEPNVDRLPLDDGAWLLAGSADVEALEELFDIELGEIPYETVGGLVFTELGYLPQPGETLERHGVAFEVLEVVERRIARVRARAQQEE